MAELDLIFDMTELALISKSEEPLKGRDITFFMTWYRYCDYFKASNALGVLKSRGLIDEIGNDTYSITQKGIDTLEALHDRITPGMEADFDKFYKTRKQKGTITANYDVLSNGRGCQVHLSFRQNRRLIFEVNMHVTTIEQAEKMCFNFREHCNDIYGAMMEQLLMN